MNKHVSTAMYVILFGVFTGIMWAEIDIYNFGFALIDAAFALTGQH